MRGRRGRREGEERGGEEGRGSRGEGGEGRRGGKEGRGSRGEGGEREGERGEDILVPRLNTAVLVTDITCLAPKHNIDKQKQASVHTHSTGTAQVVKPLESHTIGWHTHSSAKLLVPHPDVQTWSPYCAD